MQLQRLVAPEEKLSQLLDKDELQVLKERIWALREEQSAAAVVQFICRQITSQTPRTCAPWNNMQRYTTSTPETD